MTITVVPNSAAISVVTRPTVQAPQLDAQRFSMVLASTPIKLRGQCTLTGELGEDPTGWMFGFIQVELFETNWAYYQGKSNTDGSTLMQYGHLPARVRRSCRDTLRPTSVFYDFPEGFSPTVLGRSAKLPQQIGATLYDYPYMSHPMTVLNSLTGKPNYLHEAQMEWPFCDVLCAKDPAGSYQHLLHIYWNLRWQVRIQPSSFSNVTKPWNYLQIAGTAGNAANVGLPSKGGPSDHRFTALLTAPFVPTCNDVGNQAYANPKIEERRTWYEFDVRH
jgi:hypothetical protein